MANITKRPARRRKDPTLERAQYLENVKSVSKLFDELFNDYRLNPSLIPEIKKGLEKGWIKNEYVRKKFDYLIDRINDGENMDMFLEVLKTGRKEKFVTKNYANKRLEKGRKKLGEGDSEYYHKERREVQEFRYALTELLNGGILDINMHAFENGKRKGYFHDLLKEKGDLNDRFQKYIKQKPFWKKYLEQIL